MLACLLACLIGPISIRDDLMTFKSCVILLASMWVDICGRVVWTEGWIKTMPCYSPIPVLSVDLARGSETASAKHWHRMHSCIDTACPRAEWIRYRWGAYTPFITHFIVKACARCTRDSVKWLKCVNTHIDGRVVLMVERERDIAQWTYIASPSVYNAFSVFAASSTVSMRFVVEWKRIFCTLNPKTIGNA